MVSLMYSVATYAVLNYNLDYNSSVVLKAIAVRAGRFRRTSDTPCKIPYYTQVHL